MNTNFITTRATFTTDASTLNATVSTNFSTDIQKLTATVQSWKIRTGSDREVRDLAISVDNIQSNGTNASCTVSLTLADSEPQWVLEANSCYVDILFIAICD